MSNDETQLWSRLHHAEDMDFGPRQQELIEDVVSRADALRLPKLAFAARRALASAYSVDRQWDKAFPLFQHCLRTYDADPDRFGPEEGRRLNDWYASIVQSMAEFPDVPLERIHDACADMEKRFAAADQDPIDVYDARRWIAQLIGDWDEEERWYRRWLAAGGPDEKSVWDFEVGIERLILRGDRETEALEAARPVLDGRVTFDEPPAPIQCLMLLPLARNGEHDKAARAYRRALRAGFEQPYRYEYGGMMVEFCALTGNRERGLTEMRRRLGGFGSLNRPNGKMEFAASAVTLLRQFDPETEGTRLIGRRLGEEPSVSINQLREDMTEVALRLAAEFDARNGTTYQGDRIRAKLRREPFIDFIPLVPFDRPANTVAIAEGTSAADILDRAEWHYRGYEYDTVERYLAALPPALPPALRARATELRALLDNDDTTEETLRWAGEEHRQWGDRPRFLLSLCWLAKLLAGKADRGEEAHRTCGWAVQQLRATGDRSAMAWGYFRLAQVMVTLNKPGEYEVLDRAMELAAEVGDDQAIGIMGEVGAYWRECDLQDPDVVIARALEIKDKLLSSGAEEKGIGLFNTLKRTFVRAGTPEDFEVLVRAQLDNLPDQAADELVGHLRYERGMALMREGQPGQALPDLTEGVAQSYRHQHARAEQWFQVAQAAFYSGDLDQAVEAAEKAAIWTEDWREKGKLEHPAMADEAQLILARCFRGLGFGKLALEAYEQLEKQAREYQSTEQLAACHTEWGELLAAFGDLEQSASCLEEATRLHTLLGDEAESRRCQGNAHRLRDILAGNG